MWKVIDIHAPSNITLVDALPPSSHTLRRAACAAPRTAPRATRVAPTYMLRAARAAVVRACGASRTRRHIACAATLAAPPRSRRATHSLLRRALPRGGRVAAHRVRGATCGAATMPPPTQAAPRRPDAPDLNRAQPIPTQLTLSRVERIGSARLGSDPFVLARGK